MNTEQISRVVAVTRPPHNNKKKCSFIIGIILSKHALGVFNLPKLSKVWWLGRTILVKFQTAARRLILEDVWGGSGGAVPAL